MSIENVAVIDLPPAPQSTSTKADPQALALEQDGTRTGSLAPEDWTDPDAFYKALERVGTPRDEIVDPV